MSALWLLLCVVCAPVLAQADTWAVYWYVCGSDMERKYGNATGDIAEALKAELGEDVTIVLQTGGTKKWQNDVFSNTHLERYVIEKDDLHPVQTLPQASMGDKDVLASFLHYCRDKHKADHAVLIIWDHGGGSALELANDDNFHGDGLTLEELRQALEATWTPDAGRPPLEIIGFDACLMATLDVAKVAHGFARYMVASQDVEPGNGWEYTGLLNALARNTDMDGASLGRIICDTYLAGCKDAQTDAQATLSVIDLAKLPQVLQAWNWLGLEAINAVADDSGFFAVMGRQAEHSENYANIKGQFFSNMVDMGAYVGGLASALPEYAGQVLDALQTAVIHKVNGRYRKASGLSFYYPLDGGKTYDNMLRGGTVTAFLVLQGLQVNKVDADTAIARLEAIAAELDAAEGESEQSVSSPQQRPPSPDGQGALVGGLAAIFQRGASAVLSTLKPLEPLDISALEDAPITISDTGDATLRLGPEQCTYLSSVNFYLAYFDVDEDVIVILGKDADVQADWEKGEFRDHFRNTWAAIDDHLVSLEVTQIEDDFYRYAVPVKLKGERVNLDVIYDFASKEYTILGARKPAENGVIDKFLYKLRPDDEITTVFTAMTISADEDDSREVDIDTFTLTSKSKMEDIDMGDGTFVYMFEMNDVQGNSALSQVASIEVKNGEIRISKVDE